MNVLFVVAHPDDEALGGGGTIAKLVESGHNVDVAVLNTFDVTAYEEMDAHKELLAKSHRTLGIRNSFLGEYEDSNMNTADHREMVQFIENAMLETQPSVVFTHHPSDVNEDHRWVFQSVMEAFRIGQRQRYEIAPIKELLLMEVQSSTDWGIDPSKMPFRPNSFFEITQEHLIKKLASLQMYKGVLRDSPHPRRIETIEGLAKLRGSQAGYAYAEAFECVFRRMM